MSWLSDDAAAETMSHQRQSPRRTRSGGSESSIGTGKRIDLKPGEGESCWRHIEFMHELRTDDSKLDSKRDRHNARPPAASNL